MSAEPAVSPAAVVAECDVADGIPYVPAPRPGIEALILVRAFTEPIGMLTEVLPGTGLSADELGHKIAAELAPQLRDRFEECGLAWTGELPTAGVAPPRTPRFLSSRDTVTRDGPSITAVICTHGRPESLPLALESLTRQEYPRIRILVIDNAPTDETTRRLVAELSIDHDISYAIEPRKGLSWARNRAVELADGEVIAWVDDDERADRWWASEIARGFVEIPGADGVTGTVAPSELETPSQMFFEQYASVRRRRGFTRDVFSPATRWKQSPLYPLPPFGIGGNMAFKRRALEDIGGFDNALGPGMLTQNADDIAAISGVLLAGGTIVYQPSAVVYHRNRRDGEVLRDLFVDTDEGWERSIRACCFAGRVAFSSCFVSFLRRCGISSLRAEAV